MVNAVRPPPDHISQTRVESGACKLLEVVQELRSPAAAKAKSDENLQITRVSSQTRASSPTRLSVRRRSTSTGSSLARGSAARGSSAGMARSPRKSSVAQSPHRHSVARLMRKSISDVSVKKVVTMDVSEELIDSLMERSHSLPGKRRSIIRANRRRSNADQHVEVDLATAAKKMATTFAPGDCVQITKMGNRTGDIAIVLLGKTTEGGRIRITMQQEGATVTRSYYEHELKKLPPMLPEWSVEREPSSRRGPSKISRRATARE